MKIPQNEIKYIEYLCDMLPKILKDINEEYEKEDYLYQSPNRARFDRLRLEMNKSLMNIKKIIYNGVEQ